MTAFLIIVAVAIVVVPLLICLSTIGYAKEEMLKK